MSTSTIIEDLRGWSCSEACPYCGENGCTYGIDKKPIDCPVMIQRYAFDVLTDQKKRLKPKTRRRKHD